MKQSTWPPSLIREYQWPDGKLRRLKKWSHRNAWMIAIYASSRTFEKIEQANWDLYWEETSQGTGYLALVRNLRRNGCGQSGPRTPDNRKWGNMLQLTSLQRVLQCVVAVIQGLSPHSTAKAHPRPSPYSNTTGIFPIRTFYQRLERLSTYPYTSLWNPLPWSY